MAETTAPGLNILLVEDDSDDISFFKEAVLKLDPFNEVTVVGNCDLVFEHLNSETIFDVIFLDINLPFMDGKECLKQLKASERFKETPIIMFTGSNAQTDVDEAYENGAHYHVVKPYAQINYIASLKTVLDCNWKEKQPRPPKETFVINLAFI